MKENKSSENSFLEQHLNSKLTDIEIKIEEIRANVMCKLEDKVPFKLFLLLISLIIGNLGFQWAIYEKALEIEYTTEKSLVEFNIKIENTQERLGELRRAVKRRNN